MFLCASFNIYLKPGFQCNGSVGWPNCYLLKLALYKRLITQVEVEEMVISTVYTPLDMPIPAFLSACNAGLFTGELYGIIVARNLWYGCAAQEWSMVLQIVLC